jgi:GT2 family glycosyltransferase
MLELFKSSPDIDVLFGSYDDEPTAPGVLTQYRNLLHHYIHQTGSREASTFWAGLGAIRRSAFEAVGGFDEKRWARRMEDIELGYRLREAGYRICMDPAIQGTHLKKWTVKSMVRTDVYYRAMPWARLMLERKKTVVVDLNIKHHQQASVALVGLACVSLLLSVVWWQALIATLLALAGAIALNRRFYAFLIRKRGIAFTIAALPLHWFYFLYSGLGFALVWCDHQLRHLGMRQASFHESRL